MQPDPPPESAQPPPPPAQPAAGWPPPSSHWTAQASAPTEGAGPVATIRRGRPGLVVLVAVLVEVIVIAAADNQWVAERVGKAVFDSPNSLSYDLALSLLTYQWRFNPSSSDSLHFLYGQWELIGVTLVLTAVLVLLAARGGAGFGKVFFGTWTAVIAATGAGAIVRGVLVNSQVLQGQSRFQSGLFGNFGPTQHVFIGGVGLGLVTGLAAGITALAARREERVAPPMPPPVPDEPVTTQFERPPADPDATQEFRPGHAEEPEATQELPRTERP